MMQKNKKFNKYPQIPEEELDLHGLFAEEARNAVYSFLERSRRNKYKRIRIITGKGWHSSGGKGILKNMVTEILRKENIKYSDAKIEDGGTGAINIEL